MKKKNFIVPHDFSEVADIALNHAIAVAKPLEAKIFVLHVVSKEKEIDNAEKNLAKVCDENKNKGVELIPSVRRGSIFEDIPIKILLKYKVKPMGIKTTTPVIK